MISVYPQGVNELLIKDRKPIFQIYNGDSIVLTGRFTLKNNLPVNYSNSILNVSISDQRFSNDIIWTGVWRSGIELIDEANHPGLIKITIPDDISDSLRRGSYICSLQIRDILGNNRYTPLEAMLHIEYSPTSDTRDIPYKTT